MIAVISYTYVCTSGVCVCVCVCVRARMRVHLIGISDLLQDVLYTQKLEMEKMIARDGQTNGKS